MSSCLSNHNNFPLSLGEFVCCSHCSDPHCPEQLLWAPGHAGGGLALAATMVMVTPPRVMAPNRPPQANICLKQHSRSPWMSPLSCPKTNQDTSAPKPTEAPTAAICQAVAVHIRGEPGHGNRIFFSSDVTLLVNKACFGGAAQMPLQFPHIQAKELAHLPQASHQQS